MIHWVYKTWIYFWRTMLVLVGLTVLFGGGVFGILQLETTQQYIADRLEREFNYQFRGDLHISNLEGLLPFHFQFTGVEIDSPVLPSDKKTDTTPVEIDTVSVQLDLTGLLQRRLIIDQLNIVSPHVHLISTDTAGYTIEQAFEKQRPETFNTRQNLFSRISVVAPYLDIKKGRLKVDRFQKRQQLLNLPQSFVADSINLSLYVELSKQKRFLDIEQFSAMLPELGRLTTSGQVFSEDSLLELNGFEVHTNESVVQLTGSVKDFKLWEGEYIQQFRRARYNMRVDTAFLNVKEWKQLGMLGGVPDVNGSIGIRGALNGDHNRMDIKQLELFKKSSRVVLQGNLQELFDPAAFNYHVVLDTLNINRNAISRLTQGLKKGMNGNWQFVKGKGMISGSLDSLKTRWDLVSDYGKLSGNVSLSLKTPYTYSGHLQTDSLNIAGWFGESVPSSNLNMSVSGNGMGTDWKEAVWNLEGNISNSSFRGISVNQMDFQVNYIEGFIEPSFSINNPGGETLDGKGWVDLSRSPNKLQFSGNARNLNLRHILRDSVVSSTHLNLSYNLELNGHSFSSLFGHASVDVGASTIGGDSVRSHSFYADLDEPNSGKRLFRLTSSILDFEVRGDIAPAPMMDLYRHWKPYLYSKIRNKVLLDSTAAGRYKNVESSKLQPVNFTTEVEFKKVELVNRYFKNVPSLESNSTVDAQIKADSTSILIRSTLRDRKIKVGRLSMRNPTLQLTGNFIYGRKMSNFGSLSMEANFSDLHYQNTHLQNYRAELQLVNDSLHYEHQVKQPSGDIGFNLVTNVDLRDSALVAQIDRFYIGNENYAWSQTKTPTVTYMSSGKIKFDQFRFQSEKEQVYLKGVYSGDLDDAVHYHFQNIQLHRISQMIGSRVQFSGTLNADFHTRAITSQPSVEGQIQVNEFRLNDRLVGDVYFESEYNPKQKLFDTRINIRTDSTKYADYINRNNGIGQDIRMDGYLQPPAMGDTKDHLFKFNVDFREIDMWVVREIVPKIVDEVEGRAVGEGWISGNMNSYDFHADFTVRDVYVNTKFLNTNYRLTGPIDFDKQQGLIFNEVQITDRKGGSGELTGRVGLNDFKPVKFFDLSLSMNKLQFLNNSMDQEGPFFGEMYGSGRLHLSGTNKEPFLRTTKNIRVTEGSQLSIPLLEETELNQDNRFIQFVDRFQAGKTKKTDQKENKNGNGDEEDKSFTELFRLDLQFVSTENTTVKLIFDPVTGEILTARGNGQLNIRLEDDEVRMFGTYHINRGSYQFVSGDIFTRKFQLESGGKLSWQGDPENAELDITAVYNERPSVSSLMGNRTSKQTKQKNIQNIPIDLVLHITGTLSAINNEFYFRLPNTMDISQNVAIANRINQLNRDDEQKLLQATSLLLTGEFIPVTGGGAGFQQTNFGENISGSSVVLNPLLSNQIFSPLLSNQINALLNSDISSLDVDINLNAYNQVDLGIALRLYNNRLVLRREGQVTGPQSTLGNLGATYRINQHFSVKAFHRQDLTLSNVTNAQTQIEYLNGAGVEARVQFNTWKGLTRRFFNSIKQLFTGKSGNAQRKKEGDLVEMEGEK